MGYFLSLLFLLFATPAFATYCPNCGGTGGISSVTGTSPVNVSAGASPVVSLTFPNCANDGSHAYTGPTGAGSILCSTINSGAGTVTSVGFSLGPSWLTLVGTSPITGAGSFTLNATSGLTANSILATPDGTTGALAVRKMTAGDLPLPTASGLGGVQSKAAVANNFLTSINTADGSVGQAQVQYSNLGGTPTQLITSTVTSTATNVTLALPGGSINSVQRVNLTGNSVISLPSASWIPQQVQLVVCQDATGGRVWSVTGSGITVRGTIGTPTTTANTCQMCGFSYVSSMSEAFLTNPGCTAAE